LNPTILRQALAFAFLLTPRAPSPARPRYRASGLVPGSLAAGPGVAKHQILTTGSRLARQISKRLTLIRARAPYRASSGAMMA
jgi:hypothetical protein